MPASIGEAGGPQLFRDGRWEYPETGTLQSRVALREGSLTYKGPGLREKPYFQISAPISLSPIHKCPLN